MSMNNIIQPMMGWLTWKNELIFWTVAELGLQIENWSQFLKFFPTFQATDIRNLFNATHWKHFFFFSFNTFFHFPSKYSQLFMEKQAC